MAAKKRTVSNPNERAMITGRMEPNTEAQRALTEKKPGHMGQRLVRFPTKDRRKRGEQRTAGPVSEEGHAHDHEGEMVSLGHREEAGY